MKMKQVKKLSKLDLRKIQSNKLKQSLVDEKTKIKNLLNFLCKCSTGYNDKLLDFMEEYHMDNLRQVTSAQLKQFIAKHNLHKVKNHDDKTL